MNTCEQTLREKELIANYRGGDSRKWARPVSERGFFGGFEQTFNMCRREVLIFA